MPVLTVFVPRSIIMSSNDRSAHWGSRHGSTRDLRTLAIPHRRALPRMQRARVEVMVSYPDRISRDVYNLYPTMKAFVDGLVDDGNGFLPDDNDRFLSGPHMEWSGRLSERPGKLGMFQFDLTITELDPLT